MGLLEPKTFPLLEAVPAGARLQRPRHLPRMFDLRMKRAVLVLIVLLAAVGAFGATYVFVQFIMVKEQTTYRNVSVAEAKAMIESTPSLLILDVSTEKEYAQAHLSGAVNIPVSDLPSRIGELDVNAAILVYCRTGRRSAEACSTLAKRGFTHVYNMEGGILEWVNSGYPVVTEKVISATPQESCIHANG